MRTSTCCRATASTIPPTSDTTTGTRDGEPGRGGTSSGAGGSGAGGLGSGWRGDRTTGSVHPGAVGTRHRVTVPAGDTTAVPTLSSRRPPTGPTTRPVLRSSAVTAPLVATETTASATGPAPIGHSPAASPSTRPASEAGDPPELDERRWRWRRRWRPARTEHVALPQPREPSAAVTGRRSRPPPRARGPDPARAHRPGRRSWPMARPPRRPPATPRRRRRARRVAAERARPRASHRPAPGRRPPSPSHRPPTAAVA